MPDSTVILISILLLLPCHLGNQRLSTGLHDFCDQTSECITKVRRMAQESNRFWFGDQWHFNCGQQSLHSQQRDRHKNKAVRTHCQPKVAGLPLCQWPVRAVNHFDGAQWAFTRCLLLKAFCTMPFNHLDCLNPPELAPFASLGSRLFRVHTFTPAYSANLRIFPRMHFQPRTGFYRACSHNFEVTVSEDERLFGLFGHPQAQPIPAFQAQLRPDLNWPEMHANQSLVVLMLDVGWGRLAYLAIGFPRDTKILSDFLPVDNFRPQQPSPLAVLIFELPRSEAEAKSILEGIELKWTNPRAERRDNFHLSQFMLENRLERGLIGLNWALIEADPFAIEKQRIQGMPDNCHALVLQKLMQDQRWHFVQTFPLSAELDSSLSISMNQPQLVTRACCQTEALEKQQIFLDPLGDAEVPTALFRQGPPTITSLRPMESGGEPAYQRASRHYIVYRDERFSLLLFDPDRRMLHWLLVDIPAEGLAAGSFQEAITVADYMPPVPEKPGDCLFALFMLFRQPRAEPMAEFFDRDHPLRHAQCQAQRCPHRADFNVEQFKALHWLHLSAISWASVCFDLHEASHQISLLRKKPELTDGVDRAAKFAQDGKRNKKGAAHVGTWDKQTRDRQIAAICAHFPLNDTQDGMDREDCDSSTSGAPSTLAHWLTSFSLTLLFCVPFILQLLRHY